jgi:hypothetical protein
MGLLSGGLAFSFNNLQKQVNDMLTTKSKQKPPSKIQSLKFGCEKFEIWLTGDRKTISIGVSRVEDGFTYDDGFCKIGADFRLKLEKETITIGTESQRHYSILITDCEYSFWQLCDYFKDLCSEYNGEENE